MNNELSLTISGSLTPEVVRVLRDIPGVQVETPRSSHAAGPDVVLRAGQVGRSKSDPVAPSSPGRIGAVSERFRIAGNVGPHAYSALLADGDADGGARHRQEAVAVIEQFLAAS